MIPVKFDISELISLYDMQPAEAIAFKKYTVQRVVAAFMRNIVGIAGKELHQTRSQYINSLVMKDVGESAVEVELMGFMPNAVEKGMSPFDMKEGFMRSPKRTQKIGGGWYLTVPFRHANPNAVGDAATFSGVMPREVYANVVSFKTKQRLTKGMLPSQFGFTVRPPVKVESTEYASYKSKHSIYEGMTKENKSGGGHGHYITFRRVSDKSSNDAWVHSGIKAHNLFDKAVKAANILYEVDLARDEFFSKIGV